MRKPKHKVTTPEGRRKPVSHAPTSDATLLNLGIAISQAISEQLELRDVIAVQKLSRKDSHVVRRIDAACLFVAKTLLKDSSLPNLQLIGEDIPPPLNLTADVVCCLDPLDGTEHWVRNKNLYCTAISFFIRRAARYELRVSLIRDASGDTFFAREDLGKAYMLPAYHAAGVGDPIDLSITQRRIQRITHMSDAHVCTAARRPSHFQRLSRLLPHLPFEGFYCHGGNPVLASLAINGYDGVFQIDFTQSAHQAIWDWLPGLHIAFRSGCTVMSITAPGPRIDIVSHINAYGPLATAWFPYVAAPDATLARDIAVWASRWTDPNTSPI